MFNRSANLAMSTNILEALPGKLDIKRHSPSSLYLLIENNADHVEMSNFVLYHQALHDPTWL